MVTTLNKKQHTNKPNQWFNRLSDSFCFFFCYLTYYHKNYRYSKMIMPNLDRVTVIQAFFEIVLIKLWKVQNSSFSVSDIGFCCSINHHHRWQFRIFADLPAELLFWQKQPPNVFCTNHVLKNFTKFTWKHLPESVFNKGLQLY